MRSEDRKGINGRQLRAARALLGWSAQDLADRARVGVATVRRAEVGDVDSPVAMIPSTESAVRAAMEAAGVIFVAENGEGAGVRMRKSAAAPPNTERS